MDFLFEMSASYLARDSGDVKEDEFGMQHWLSLMYMCDDSCTNYLNNWINIIRGKEISIYRHQKYTTVRVENTKVKRIKLYRSLKHLYFKFTLDQTYNDVLQRLHDVLLEQIDFGGIETYEVVKALLHLYSNCFFNSKRHQVMEVIRKLFYSPHSEVVVGAEKMLKIVTTWYTDNERSEELKKHLRLKHWDKYLYLSFTFFLQCGRRVEGELEFLSSKIADGFSSNYTNRAASVMFAAILSLTKFDKFEKRIYPTLLKKLLKEDSRTYDTSITNYLIPIALQEYGTDFVTLCGDLGINFKLNLYFHLCKKKSIADKPMSYLEDALETRNTKTIKLGFNILCWYGKLNAKVDEAEIDLLKRYLTSFSTYDKFYVDKYKQFLSQMCLNVGAEECPADYLTFFSWMYEYCTTNIKAQKKVKLSCKLFSSTVKILVRSSDFLKTTYTLPTRRKYDDECNPIYRTLIEKEIFKFLSIECAKILISQFNNVIENSGPISKLIIKYFLKVVTPDDIKRMTEERNVLLKRSNLSTAQKCKHITLMLLHLAEDAFKYRIVLSIHQELLNEYEVVRAGDIYAQIETNPLFVCLDCIDALMEPCYVEKVRMVFVFGLCETIIMHCINNMKLKSRSINKSVEYSLTSAICLMHKIIMQMVCPLEEVTTIVRTLSFVIQESNLKKPVSYAGKTLERIVKDGTKYKQLYKQLYREQQEKFAENSNRTSQLRKHPQTNLIMHILLKGINEKDFVIDAINFLMTKGLSSETALAASLDLLSALVGDVTFKRMLAKQLPSIMYTAILNLDGPASNTAMNLFMVLTRRLLGVKGEAGRAQLSAVELFKICPDIRNLMFFFLFSPVHSNTVKRAILSFISETEYFERLYTPRDNFNSKTLLQLTSNVDLGQFAIDAYVASCNFDDIYDGILDEIKVIMNNDRGEDPELVLYLIEQLFKRFMRHNNEWTLVIKLNAQISEMFRKLHLNPFYPYAMLENQKSEVSLIKEALIAVSHSPSLFYKQTCMTYILKNTKKELLPTYLRYIFLSDFDEDILLTYLEYIAHSMKDSDTHIQFDMLVVLVNELTRCLNPPIEIIRLFYNLIGTLLDGCDDLSSCVNKFEKGETDLTQKHIRIQEIWLFIYSCKELSEEETNDQYMILKNMIDIAEHGTEPECYFISRMLKHVCWWIFPIATKCDILYLLMILSFKVNNDDALIQYFISISGVSRSLIDHLKWLNNIDVLAYVIDDKTPTFKINMSKVILRTMKHVSAHAAKINITFFTKSSAVSNTMAAYYCVSSMLGELYQKCDL